MTSAAAPVVGILAGGGSLPREIAEAVTARGGRVHIVAIAGEADADYGEFPVTRVGWAQIGGMLAALQGAGCRELVIVGGVRRPDLAALRPDWGFFRNLPAILRIIGAGGDDGVLSRVVRFFEAYGLKVVAPATVAPELLVAQGPLGSVSAAPREADDVAAGLALVAALGPYDVGQAVVVARGRVLTIEGAEGTDAMLERLALWRAEQGSAAWPPAAAPGVLVKRPKPGQELRIDLPAIGPATVRRAYDAGLAGIAVLAGGALAAERAKLIANADAAGLFVQGFAAATPAPAASAPIYSIEWIGRWTGNVRQRADVLKGVGLIAAAAPYAASRAAVVDRGHVLAVECGEGISALIERAAGLRQWGRQRFTGRGGLAVLADPADLRAALARAAAARLAGVAVLADAAAAHAAVGKEFLAEADRLGMVVAVVRSNGGSDE